MILCIFQDSQSQNSDIWTYELVCDFSAARVQTTVVRASPQSFFTKRRRPAVIAFLWRSDEISSAPTPKITQKPDFGGPSMQNLLSVSHTLYGATKVKLYSYIGIGKYLRCVKIFPLEGVQGVQGPLM